MSLAARLAAIRSKLARVAAADVERELFGASSHDYELDPPWPDDAILALEVHHRIVLPPEYRAFLAEVGSAGAGPGYGLIAPQRLELDAFPSVTSTVHLADGSVVASGTPHRPGFGRAAVLARPFPLAGTFAPLAAYDLPVLPHGATPYDGALELCSHGCGYFDFLVVAGPWAGQVWSDTMAAVRDGAITPTGLGFFDWYERWLDGALATFAAG